MSRTSRLPWRGAALGLACGLASWILALQPVGRGLEDWFHDAGFDWRGTRPTRSKVVIVALDDASLRALPKPMAAASPELAEVVTFLDQQKATAIGLDIFVPETLDGYDAQPGLGGKAVGLATARCGRVVLPVTRDDDRRLLRPLTSWQTVDLYGLIEVAEDPDHFVRRQQLAPVADNQPHDSFALALLDVAGRAEAEGGALRVDGRVVPRDAADCIRINFVGPPGTIPQVPFHFVLAAAHGDKAALVDQYGRPADFAGATVIVGATARSLSDWHAMPYANGAWRLPWSAPADLMAGPELQANMVATLADGAYITTPWWLSSLPWVLLIGAALGASFSRLNLTHGALLALAYHFGWKWLAFGMFAFGAWRVEIVAMLLTGAACYAAAFAMRWYWLRQMFGVVKGEAIARALADDPGHLRLKGQRHGLTVLFSDIRDFTSFCERHKDAPEKVVTLLNDYFGEVVPILEAHGATVDKYMGDGIMALFNAPESQEDHALWAVRAAVAMVERVHALAGHWAELEFEGMRIGVGIHTGDAVIGPIGSLKRLDFTAVGDTVNTASRIESANKTQGTEVLVSAATYAAVPEPERALLRLAAAPEFVPVKGKDGLLALHRVDFGAGRVDGATESGRNHRPAAPVPGR
jgi:adenylate cyclase